MLILGIMIAGAFGALARFAVDGWIRRGWPGGTLTVNVTGSAALGLLVGLGLYHGLGSTPRLVLGTGFLGAYTTFSTWMFETVRLAEDGSWGAAAANLAISVFAGTGAAAIGLVVAASV